MSSSTVSSSCIHWTKPYRNLQLQICWSSQDYRSGFWNFHPSRQPSSIFPVYNLICRLQWVWTIPNISVFPLRPRTAEARFLAQPVVACSLPVLCMLAGIVACASSAISGAKAQQIRVDNIEDPWAVLLMLITPRSYCCRRALPQGRCLFSNANALYCAETTKCSGQDGPGCQTCNWHRIWMDIMAWSLQALQILTITHEIPRFYCVPESRQTIIQLVTINQWTVPPTIHPFIHPTTQPKPFERWPKPCGNLLYWHNAFAESFATLTRCRFYK